MGKDLIKKEDLLKAYEIENANCKDQYHKERKAMQEAFLNKVNRYQEFKRSKQQNLRKEHIIKTQYKNGILGLASPENKKTPNIYRNFKKEIDNKHQKYSAFIARKSSRK